MFAIIFMIYKPRSAIHGVKKWAGDGAPIWGAGVPQPIIPKDA